MSRGGVKIEVLGANIGSLIFLLSTHRNKRCSYTDAVNLTIIIFVGITHAIYSIGLKSNFKQDT